MRSRTYIFLLIVFVATPVAAQWQRVAGPQVAGVSSVIQIGQRLMASSTYLGLKYSEDGGRTWSRVNGFQPPNFITSLHVVDSLLFAVDGLIALSTNGGDSWVQGDGPWGIVRAIAPYAGRLYAVGDVFGLSVSYNKGRDWSRLDTFDEPAYGLHAEDSVLLASNVSTVFRSTDTGATWQASLPGQYMCTLHRAGDGLYAGTRDGRIWYTSDLGLTWSERTGTHPIAKITQISHSGDTLYTASSAGLHRRVGRDSVWQNISGSWICGAVTIHRRYGNTSYIAAPDGLLRSTDNGVTWSHIPPFTVSPAESDLLVEHDTLYLATSFGLYIRNGASAEWQHANHSLVRCATVSFVRRDGDVLWAGADSSLLRSHDNGATWEQIVHISGGMFTLTRVADTLIVGGRDWLRVSTDAGVTWTRPMHAGQNPPVIRAIAHHRGMWFAGASSNGGLFRSADAGASWNDIGPDGHSYHLLAHDEDSLYAFASGTDLRASGNGGDSWHAIPPYGYENSNVRDIRMYGHTLLLLSTTSVLARYLGARWWRKSSYATVSDTRFMRVVDDTVWVGTDTSGIVRHPMTNLIGVAPVDARVPSDITIVGLSPHPAHGELMVEFETRNSGSVELDVWDALGRHVMGKRAVVAAGARHREHIALPPTSSGIHLLRLRTAHGAATRAFLVM